MHRLLRAIFKRLDEEKIVYCLMRDGSRLEQFARGGELDLLVSAGQLPRLKQVLKALGFVHLPNLGHAPHHFFIAYDPGFGEVADPAANGALRGDQAPAGMDGWLKLDVITEVAYGQPTHALRTSLAESCLNHRRRCGLTYVPAPEDELITLLLHCVLDKGYFADAWRERLQTLRQQVAVSAEAYLSALLVSLWGPTMTWPRLAGLIEAGDWGTLLAQREAVAARLANRDRLGVWRRHIRRRIGRKLNIWLFARRPRALSVALLAPDGAGKSTLSETLQQRFYFPVQLIYMGLYQQGDQGGKLWQLPGFSFARRLFRQWGRYLIARYHLARRRLVVFDRYTYDAMLPAPRPLNPLKRWRRWLLAHACPPPDLVILLDAPGEMLYARKGEHSPQFLETQRQNYLQLRPHIPQMVVVDATQPPDQVRREVTALLWRGYRLLQSNKLSPGRQGKFKAAHLVAASKDYPSLATARGFSRKEKR